MIAWLTDFLGVTPSGYAEHILYLTASVGAILMICLVCSMLFGIVSNIFK